MADDKAKSVGFNKGKAISQLLRFPPNLSLSSDNFGDGASHILGFTVHEYKTSGYNMDYSRGTFTDVFHDKGDAIYFIYLAIPANQTTTYNHKWIEKDGNMVAAGATDIASKINDGSYAEAMSSLLGAGGGIIAQELKTQLGDAFNTAIGNVGLTVQPFVEVLYEGTGLRNFTFHFKLIPRNPYEVQVIYDIIQVFKWASHPSTPFGNKINGTRVLGYPNVFQIKYLINGQPDTALPQGGGTENPWLHKMAPCVCTTVDVKYSQGAKNYVSYRSNKDYRFTPTSTPSGENVEGAPIFYDLTLAFQEIVFLTKAAINDGF